MAELNRQQICAELGVSESTIRRLEQHGLPFTPVGVRSHRYDLDECKAWLRGSFGGAPVVVARQRREPQSKAGKEFLEACRKVKLRCYSSDDFHAFESPSSYALVLASEAVSRARLCPYAFAYPIAFAASGGRSLVGAVTCPSRRSAATATSNWLDRQRSIFHTDQIDRIARL